MAYFEGEVPVYGNNNGFGNGWEGLIGLALVAGLFDGGFGFGGGRVGVGAPATQADLANGFAQNTLQRGIDDIILGQATMQNFINQGFAGLNNTITTGFSGVDNAVCTLGYNMQSGFNSLSHQLSDCCCATQRAIDSVKYENAKNTCDIISASNANTRAILDYMTGEKIAALQAENVALKGQISNDKQSAYIVSQLKEPCPIPAYITPNPNCCYNYGVYGLGACGASVQ